MLASFIGHNQNVCAEWVECKRILLAKGLAPSLCWAVILIYKSTVELFVIHVTGGNMDNGKFNVISFISVAGNTVW